MAEGARRHATYEDVLAASEHVVAEVLFGTLHTQPRPAFPHASATSALAADLHNPFDRGRGGPGGWVLLFEPELHLGADILVPDLAGWRRTRMPKVPNAAFVSLAPDWICEVLSPATAARDRADKMSIYAREGVPHAWLVDPLARTLEVYRLEGTKWLLLDVHKEDALVRAEPFDAVELELGGLWADVERDEPAR